MVVVNILAPIILVIATGTVLRSTGFASAGFFRETNRLVYWVGLPALLFQSTATADPELGAAAGIFAVLVISMAACIAVGYLAGWGLGLSRPSLGAFVQGAYRSNLTYVGLPVVLFALAATGQDSPQLQAEALLATVPLIPIYSIAAVAVLQGSSGQPDTRRGSAVRLLRGVLANPLVWACLLGVLFAYSGLQLPLAIDRTLVALGQMALPLALLGIGATLQPAAVRAGGTAAAIASLIKVLVAPLVGLVAARALRLNGAETTIALLYLAMPTAVISYVMAEFLGADGKLASSIVVLSTLLSMPALAIVLVLTLGP